MKTVYNPQSPKPYAQSLALSIKRQNQSNALRALVFNPCHKTLAAYWQALRGNPLMYALLVISLANAALAATL